jgi:diguanylate cyclase (GGDEF)-like protein
MPLPPKPDNEPQRLAALRASGLLDTPPEQAYDDLAEVARVICGTRLAAITLVDQDRQWFKARRGFDLGQTPLEQSFCAYTILEPEKVLAVDDAREDARFHDNPAVASEDGVRFYAGVPLLDSGGMALGALCVFDSRPGHLEPEQGSALQALGRQFSQLLQLREYSRQLELHMAERQWYEARLAEYARLLEEENADLAEQTRTDPLTGLGNRRAFTAAMAAARERAVATRTPVSVALVDLDHFKLINDLHGHAAGDQVLAAVGALFKAHFAGSGMASRWGGEEFALLMPGADLDAARLQCELLRQAIQGLAGTPVVTASMGVAQWRVDDPPGAALLRADQALYRAKSEGRDRVQTEQG